MTAVLVKNHFFLMVRSAGPLCRGPVKKTQSTLSVSFQFWRPKKLKSSFFKIIKLRIFDKIADFSKNCKGTCCNENTSSWIGKMPMRSLLMDLRSKKQRGFLKYGSKVLKTMKKIKVLHLGLFLHWFSRIWCYLLYI